MFMMITDDEPSYIYSQDCKGCKKSRDKPRIGVSSAPLIQAWTADGNMPPRAQGRKQPGLWAQTMIRNEQVSE